MPAAGLPVASMTMSTSGAAISAVGVVADMRRAAGERVGEALAASCSAGQPTRAERLARARRRQVGDADQVRCPACAATCDRNIEPNLPAPIRPTRSGLPCACALRAAD